MRRLILMSLLAATASVAHTAPPAPISKDKLLVPPAGARHYTITSIASKSGDVWAWTLPDGRAAYRMSMSLRGWVTETDAVLTLDATRRPTTIAIRGYTDTGEATENFSVDPKGMAHWTTVIDSGAAPLGNPHRFTDCRLRHWAGPRPGPRRVDRRGDRWTRARPRDGSGNDRGGRGHDAPPECPDPTH